MAVSVPVPPRHSANPTIRLVPRLALAPAPTAPWIGGYPRGSGCGHGSWAGPTPVVTRPVKQIEAAPPPVLLQVKDDGALAPSRSGIHRQMGMVDTKPTNLMGGQTLSAAPLSAIPDPSPHAGKRHPAAMSRGGSASCWSRSRPDIESEPNGGAGRRALSSKAKPGRNQDEPRPLIVRLIYLSGLAEAGWFDRPVSYQLSVHVGLEARAGATTEPGQYCTQAFRPGFAEIIAPEEELLRSRVRHAVDEASGREKQEAVGGLECRFNSRFVALVEAGGPEYFRVDVWAVRTTLFGAEPERELFGRTFVPTSEPQWQGRPCTWPVVNAKSEFVAYLTCQFTLAQVIAAIEDLRVEGVTSTDVLLTWKKPATHKTVPIVGYRVEARTLRRDAPDDGGTWRNVGEVKPLQEPALVVKNLRGDTCYRFRVRALSEAGCSKPKEIEATTGPTAPGVCGQPHLAGCAGPVLTVEWDPPSDDGGSPIVSYLVWVQPQSSSSPEESAVWCEVPHNNKSENGVQKTEIHTEELNPAVSRYVCSIAALNEVGKAGPPTPESVALPFPNPCATCGPTPKSIPLPLPPWIPVSDRALQYADPMYSRVSATMVDAM